MSSVLSDAHVAGKDDDFSLELGGVFPNAHVAGEHKNQTLADNLPSGKRKICMRGTRRRRKGRLFFTGAGHSRRGALSFSGQSADGRKICAAPLHFLRQMRIITVDNQIFVFRAGCKSPPEVKSSSGAPHEPVRFRYRQYSLDGRRREGKLLCDTTVRRIGCWKGDFL